MASRDLTRTFIERRSAAMMRRRAGGVGIGGDDNKNKKGGPTNRRGLVSDSYTKLAAGGAPDDLMLAEVRRCNCRCW